MRVRCPHCHEKFDVKHMAVLAEAARLAKRRQSGDVSDVGEVDGNVRAPEEQHEADLTNKRDTGE